MSNPPPSSLGWKKDPMNKWNPSKSGKIVMDERHLHRLEEASIAERILDNIKEVCSLTASSAADLTRIFLGEEINSAGDIRDDQAARLLESYENSNPEKYDRNGPFYVEAHHNDNPEAMLIAKERCEPLLKLMSILYPTTR